MQPTQGAGLAGRIYVSLYQGSDADSCHLKDWLGSHLGDKEQDLVDSHGAASSPSDFCCSQSEKPGWFQEVWTTALMRPEGAV